MNLLDGLKTKKKGNWGIEQQVTLIVRRAQGASKAAIAKELGTTEFALTRRVTLLNKDTAQVKSNDELIDHLATSYNVSADKVKEMIETKAAK